MEAYIEYVILIFLLVFFCLQLYYLLGVQRKLAVYHPKEKTINPNFKASVIICARNEAANLKENLPFIFEQKGIDFEVVVVNDCSSDTSDEILRAFKAEYNNLKIVTKDEHPLFKTGKKFAVTLGIKASSNEVLVFTDADCKPETNQWLATICSNYEDTNTEIVLGYSPYKRSKGLLNLLIRYETFQTALNYFSFAIKGMPYMGVGRNLSYKKSLFFRGKGFASHMHIQSGDDDLFVNQNANEYNTAIEIRPESNVWTEAKTTWKAYWMQKLRHFGAGKAYKKSHKLQLTLQALSSIGFYAFVLLGALLTHYWPYVLAAFVLRFLIQSFVFYKSFIILRYKDLIWWLLFIDPLYYLFLVIISVRRLFRKKQVWK
ncbi:glycosyltransferase [Pseudopedobacter beijingensis]|uniref:Glycosyltransferase n=1 Tax=Pseudopedobacter beijingensis TaxID=1207056 RepID=A0ABW4IC22_9SPHI